MTTLKALYFLIVLGVLVSCDQMAGDNVNDLSHQGSVNRFRRMSETENDSATKNSLVHTISKGNDDNNLIHDGDESIALKRLRRSPMSFKKGGSVAKGGGGCKKGRK